MIRFKEVGQLALRVTDLERSVDFYSNLLGLRVFDRPQSGLVLLGCRDGRTELALMGSGGNGEAATGVHHVGYLLEDADAVEEARAHLQARDVPLVEEPAWRDPTHGAEVHFRDRNGLIGNLFSRDPATVRDDGPLPSSKESLGIGRTAIIPHRLGHIVLQVPDVEGAVEFYTKKVGLKLTEWNDSDCYFMRGGVDHHDLAFFRNRQGTGVLYNHVAWDIGNMTDLWNCGEFLREREIPITLGPGWWEQGHQTDLNFIDPDEQRIEIYCYIDQVAGDPEPVGPSPAFYHPFDFVPPYNPHAKRAG